MPLVIRTHIQITDIKLTRRLSVYRVLNQPKGFRAFILLSPATNNFEGERESERESLLVGFPAVLLEIIVLSAHTTCKQVGGFRGHSQ